MRPIKLAMTAFGPYKNKEVINFSDLQDHSLFVVAGNTGAGKTTIFDAICFALYGSASGQDRDHHSMLRSHFADPEIHTAVELIFTIHNRTYRVLRQLAHIKPGNKTPTGENYEFFEIVDGGEIPVIERQIVSEINKKVEEIIGLTENQFKQIVMLPQGEFLKLLTSETENKEAILRRLFKTDHYQQLNELLRQRKNLVEDQYNQEKLAYEQHIAHIHATLPERENSQLFFTLNAEHYNEQQVIASLAEEKDYYFAKATSDEKEYKQATRKHEVAQQALYVAQALNKKFNELAEKEQLLKQLNDKKPVIAEQEQKLVAAERADKIKPYEEQYKRTVKAKQTQIKIVQKLSNDVTEAKKQLSEAQKKFAAEKEKESLQGEIRKTLDRLKEHLPFVEALSERQAKVAKLHERVKSLLKSVNTFEKSVKAKREEKTKITQNLRQLESILDQFSIKQQELVAVKEKLSFIENYEAVQQNLLETKENVTTKELVYKKAKDYYIEQEEAWLSNQAHHLALHLKDGKPCPVCGSEHHPQPALAMEKQVTRDELTKMKEQASAAESDYNKETALLKTYEQQIEALKPKLAQLIIDGAEVTEVKKSLIVEREGLTKTINELLEKQKTLQYLRKQEQEAEEQLENLQANWEKARSSYLQERTALKEAEAILANEIERVPEDVRELNKLKKEITQREQELVSLVKAYEEAEKALHASQAYTTKLTTELDVAEERLVEVKVEAKESERVFLQVLQDNHFTNTDQYYSAILDKREQERLKESILTFRQHLQLTIEQIKDLQKELDNKEKADLEAIEKQVTKLKEIAEQTFRTWQRSKSLYKEADRLRELLVATVKRAEKYEKKLNIIADLYNVARGQNELRLSFERFLQIEYLEQIIHAANQRLQHLSNGQFWLQRSDRQESHGRQSGLAFDVFDEYTGKVRDVKTLSGGEKFNASLCLALGMSDVIQSFQGNISIETMFIDEGFGTLDEETLNKSIETLIDLQASGRMIGVISHVQALKTIFPAVLEVTKTREGYSQTKFIVN